MPVDYPCLCCKRMHYAGEIAQYKARLSAPSVKKSFINILNWFFSLQCVENVSHANCPVCLEDIHTSRIPCHIPNCGHLLHRTCFEDLLHSGHYACPTCQVSLLDMTDLWRFLDSEVSLTPMPQEYKDYKADILCKDCHEVSNIY